jgi:murein DD-endopeptidase MepM/ murein hydrolase activator NlpD
MPKSKYRFNPETLSYTKVENTARDKVFKVLTYVAASFVVAVLFNIIFNFFFDTPKTKGLKMENNQLLFQYTLLNERLEQINNVLDDLRHRDDNIYRTIFEAEPIHKSIRAAGFGGVDRYKELEKMKNAEIVISTARRLDEIISKTYVQTVSYDEIIDLARNKEKMLSSLPAIQPIANKDLTRTASGWGYRIHPIYKIRKFHYGMDFTAPTGTEIYATADGTVDEINRSKRGYGNKIIIDHGFGYKTLYAHLSDFKVKRGEKVNRGDVIGYVGNTGLSTAPHLHYEVFLHGKKVNPVNYYFNDLSPEEYDKMIELSLRAGQSFD